MKKLLSSLAVIALLSVQSAAFAVDLDPAAWTLVFHNEGANIITIKTIS